MRITRCRLVALFTLIATATDAQDLPRITPYGLKINTTDMTKSIDFYTNVLGFKMASKSNSQDVMQLKADGSEIIYLQHVNNLIAATSKDSQANLALQVMNIDSAIHKMKQLSVPMDGTKRREGVGYAITIYDPSGAGISLLQQTIGKGEIFEEPKIYNYGFRVADMEKARNFYCNVLNFQPLTERYLPLDLPLTWEDKSNYFMIHMRESIENIKYNSADDENVVVLFKCKNLASTIDTLKKRGVIFVQKKPFTNGIGHHISFYDSSGYISELVEMP